MMNALTSRDAISSCFSSITPVIGKNLAGVNHNRKIELLNATNDIHKSCLFIEPTELKSFLAYFTVIFLDCRPAKDFNTTHIKNSIHLNCRDRIIKKRLENKKLSVVDLIPCKEIKKKFLTTQTDCVNQQIKDAVENIKKNELIVIYDDKTSDLEELNDNPLKLVQDNIKESGVKNDCKILKGGFKLFFENFPEYCINKCETKFSFEIDPKLKANSDQTRDEIENCKLTEISSFLYLGNESDAKNLDALSDKGIFHILNITKNIPFYNQDAEKSKKFTFRRISVNDCTNEDLSQYFDEAFLFIEEARKQNSKVLVHCQAGVSRSPTIVIAYLMKTQNLKAIEAYQKIKELRSIIAPNIVFMNQLFNFEKKLEISENFCK